MVKAGTVGVVVVVVDLTLTVGVVMGAQCRLVVVVLVVVGWLSTIASCLKLLAYLALANLTHVCAPMLSAITCTLRPAPFPVVDLTCQCRYLLTMLDLCAM